MQKVNTDKTFAENLKRIRKQKGLTQEQTVAKLQVLGSPITRSTYSLIEMGKGNIFVSDLVGLRQIFGVDYHEFFKGIPVQREKTRS
ncbi:MAG: helix-turn-helix transcriptional regulator [Clostridia bacterium]|nr:helix-turn-helix transcriptional regulator [Clostridia bacterium]